MLSNIQAAENLISGDFVEFIKDGEGKLSCKKALELGSIRAIVARDIAEGEMLSFDTNGDTKDLTTPQKQSNASETAHFEDRNFDSLFGDADQGRALYAVAALSIKRTVANHPLYVIGTVLILASMVGFRTGGMVWPMLGSITGTGLILLGWEREKHPAQKDHREEEKDSVTERSSLGHKGY
jgi:hypothetical protein